MAWRNVCLVSLTVCGEVWLVTEPRWALLIPNGTTVRKPFMTGFANIYIYVTVIHLLNTKLKLPVLVLDINQNWQGVFNIRFQINSDFELWKMSACKQVNSFGWAQIAPSRGSPILCYKHLVVQFSETTTSTTQCNVSKKSITENMTNLVTELLAHHCRQTKLK